MRFFSRKIFIAAAFILGISVPAAASQAGRAAGSFMKIPAGARASALGESFTAVKGSPDSVHWNPAGIAYLEAMSHSLSYMLWVEDMGYGNYSFVYPGVHGGVLGAGVSFLSLPSTTVTLEDEFGVYAGTGGSFKAGFYKFSAGYAREIVPGLSGGLNLKMIQETLDSETGRAFAADIGVLRPGLLSGKLDAALTLQNLGTRLKVYSHSAPLPLTLRAGGAFRVSDNLLGVSDIVYDFDSGAGISAGAEYRIHDIIKFRAGYKYSSAFSNDPVKGVRAGWGIMKLPFELDYAFIPFGDLGEAHTVSVIYSF